MINNNVLLIGAGGHASVLLEILIELKINVIGYVSQIPASNKNLFSSFVWYKNDQDILKFDKSNISLVNGIGSLPGNRSRSEFYCKYKELGFSFANVISKDAKISSYATLEEGVQVMRGAIIQTGSEIGANSIVNTGSSIDHDCSIGSNNHIAPGVSISGNVTSGANVHFGTGSSVIHNIKINKDSVIASGATVTKNIDSNTICYPARTVIKPLK